MSFSSNQLSNIPQILSEPRFATYLQHCENDRAAALQLYKWNLELSSAFIVPLHFLEISLRNAVVECLERVYTSNWPWNDTFILSLPSPTRGYNPRKNLQNIARMDNPTMGRVVAELKFVFWEKMFTARHDNRIWGPHIQDVFPQAAELTIAELRGKIFSDISEIRKLRNRIAHHEPIFNRNAQADYDKMFELISFRNAITVDWMHNIQTVTNLIAERP